MSKEWKYLTHINDMDDRNYDQSTKDFDGAGWYLKEIYSKRCPRGCCYDNCVRWTPAQQVVESIKEEMKLVCERLKEAKEKAKNAV